MAFCPEKSSLCYRGLTDHSSQAPFYLSLTSYPRMSPTTPRDRPGFHHGAATTNAPGPERWHAPSPCSTADGTTNCPLPPPPDGTATNATASAPTTVPESSARSAAWSRLGTPPSPNAASGPGSRPPHGIAHRTVPPAVTPSSPWRC